MDFIICENKGSLYLCEYELLKNAKFKYFVESSLILYNDTRIAFEKFEEDFLSYPFQDVSYNLSSLRELTPIKITNVYYGISKDKIQNADGKHKIKKINKRVLDSLLGDKLCLMGNKLFTDKVIFTADSVEEAKHIFKKFIKDKNVSRILNNHVKRNYNNDISYDNYYLSLFYQAFDQMLKRPIMQKLKVIDKQLFGKKLTTLEIQPYNSIFENKFYLVLSRFPKENFTLELFEELLSNLNLKKKFDSVLYSYNLNIYTHPFSAYVYELNPFINKNNRKIECQLIDSLFDDKKSYLDYLRDNRYYIVDNVNYISKIPKHLVNKNVQYLKLKNKKEVKLWTR